MRENRTHGSIGGRWPNGTPGQPAAYLTALRLLGQEHQNETECTPQFLASALVRSLPSAARKRSPTGPVPVEM
jgi:hypothetical protein